MAQVIDVVSPLALPVTRRERDVLCAMGFGWVERMPTLDEVRGALHRTENMVAWLRAAERRMAAGAPSPFEARSATEEIDS